MDLGIAGKVALVTGASKGLGFGVARALAAEGVQVAISSRSEERIRRAADQIGASAFVHDAADLEGASQLVHRVQEQLGSLDILVANSGGPPASPDALGFSTEQWRESYEMLTLGQLELIKAALPGMRERGWGRILSLSSSVVREPSPVLVLSTAHRSALLGALKTISKQVAGDGVTVNSLLPGLIATDRIKELGSDTPDRTAGIPAGRIGQVDEFAAAAAFLCSQPAAYITGTTLLVDGGASDAV
ncbi:MAG TPA: SDR family oxidoreductase [Solirubrobacteraceae bacterium]|jgi:3-oxoacyl-[acyl-carrier protein] reductase|nr:SDR family oxidoreductase [Solirubrobacteraceae bacterium]